VGGYFSLLAWMEKWIATSPNKTNKNVGKLAQIFPVNNTTSHVALIAAIAASKRKNR
jgi:hypothetical protein